MRYPCQGSRPAGDGCFESGEPFLCFSPWVSLCASSRSSFLASCPPFSSRRPSPLPASPSLCYSLLSDRQASPGRRSLSFVASQSNPTKVGHRVVCSARENGKANEPTVSIQHCSAIIPFLLLSIRSLRAQSSRSLFCFFSRRFYLFHEPNLVQPTRSTVAFHPSLLHKKACQSSHCFFIFDEASKQPIARRLLPVLRLS